MSNFSGQPAAGWTCNPRVDTEPLAVEGEWHLRCAGCCWSRRRHCTSSGLCRNSSSPGAATARPNRNSAVTACDGYEGMLAVQWLTAARPFVTLAIGGVYWSRCDWFINDTDWKIKVKVSRNRSGVVQRVPGGLGSQIFMTFGTWRWWGPQPHAPASYTPTKCSWYSFPLGAEPTPGPWYGRKETCHWKIQWHHRESIVRLVAQSLNHYATPGPHRLENTIEKYISILKMIIVTEWPVTSSDRFKW